MSNYFERVQQGIGEAVSQGRHEPWYRRTGRAARTRGFVAAFATVAVAAPALGAVTNWFGIGAPDHFQTVSPTTGSGRALAQTGLLLPLRVADPQGGPSWGLRIVHTTRDDTCLQLGRVEGRQLGSLGIDGSWNDDHLFHPFPNTSQGYECGNNDAAGHAFVNFARTGMVASATPARLRDGAQAASCRPPRILTGKMRERAIPQYRPGTCPAGSVRIVFAGLLGPDATAITYEAPSGKLETERTIGGDGAYLLVFPLSIHNCQLYTQSFWGAYGPCGSAESMGGADPGDVGAIKAVTYRDGHVCQLVRQEKTVVRPYLAFVRTERERLNISTATLPSGRARRALNAAVDRYLKAHGLTQFKLLQAMQPQCPAVGYVTARTKLTAADLSTPVTVKRLANAQGQYRIEITFRARQPVTSSNSWYQQSVVFPPDCLGSIAESSPVGEGDVRAGRVLHVVQMLSSCAGVYHGVVGYVPRSGPTDSGSLADSQSGLSSGEQPGQGGAQLVVGRFAIRLG